MRTLFRLLPFGLAAVALFAQTAPPKTHLKVGDPAPDFELRTTAGEAFKLSGYKGKQTVVLAFFPAAFTGGCTKEMTAYQAGLAKFKDAGAQVIGISTDNLPALNYWSKEVLKIEFPLASDWQRKTAAAYGVLNTASGFANRASFVIDPQGIIQHIEEGSSAINPDGAATACSRITAR